MLKKLNARFRIIILVLASTLPVLGLAVYGELTHRADAERDERVELRLIAAQTMRRPAELVSGARQLMLATSQQVDTLLDSPGVCAERLRQLVAAQNLYPAMGLILPDGRLFCSSDAGTAGGKPADFADRPFFRLAATGGQFAVGGYEAVSLTGRPGIDVGYAVLDAGRRLRALLAVNLDPAALIAPMDAQAGDWRGAGGTATIVDRNGVVVVQQPDTGARVGVMFPNAPVLQQLLAESAGGLFAPDMNGVMRMHVFDSLAAGADGVAPLRIVVSSPEARIYADTNRALRRTILGAVLLMVLMVAVAWVGVEVLVMRRFRTLIGVAEKVRAGDFSARTGFGDSREELGRLGHALDTMVQELQVRDGQLKQALQQLNEQASTDPLTGLPNRRYLWGALDVELIRARRRQAPLAVMLMDIDHFKAFNDRWGHDAGDLVLKHVAQELRKVVRGSDIVARHGGEEFVIVLPEATESAARERAEELRAYVAGLQLSYEGATLDRVTLSVGIAISANAHESAEDLVRVADDAMYEAKRAGRNRIVVRHA